MGRSKDIIRPYFTKKDGPMVVVIPKPLRKEMNLQKGDIFLVKKEGNDRLIYRRIVSRNPD